MAPSLVLPDSVPAVNSRESAMSGLKVAKGSVTAQKCINGNKLTVTYPDAEFTFHSQWLHDSRMDGLFGAARNATTAICTQERETVRISEVSVSKLGPRPVVSVTWDNGNDSNFPAEWLRVMGPVVAGNKSEGALKSPDLFKGWTVETLEIPEISYTDIFSEDGPQEEIINTYLSILDHLLQPSSTGLIKVINMPPPNVDDELNHINNLNTIVLKRIFGSVFNHPTRGQDKSFNVSSRAAEADKRKELPNYDTNQVLLPHADHAFYEQPINVQGWYILEGTSENTFVDMPAALETLKVEDARAYHSLLNTPMSLGRVSAYYGEPVYQMTVDTAVSNSPGTSDFKRIRWHPNFIGSLLCPYEEYQEARIAQQKFLEIMRRPTHQLRIKLGPGDFYIWNNFRVLHGREKVFSSPRTGVGQTVPEQVVHDTYRRICIQKLSGLIDDQWLVHTPMAQLRELLRLVEEQRYSA